MATGFNTQVSNGEYRLQFETDNREYYLLMQETARRRVDGKPVTNADRIRAMSDEELAVLLSEPCECSVDPNEDGYRECGNKLCIEYLLNWLQQPAEEG